MNATPDITDASSPQKNPGHGGAWIIATVSIVLALVFVFPGFIAGLEIRSIGWNHVLGREPNIAEIIFYYPSNKLEEWFPAYRSFNEWQLTHTAPPVPKDLPID